MKLVLTANLSAPPRYATLSYCWGSEPFTTLTQDNLDLFLDQLPLDELPQTFNDAIDTTRRLGIEFLWIDALCIIQKEVDNSDWAKEAAYMSAVYGGTVVTLAASTATGVQDGFLHRSKHYNGGFTARVTTNAYSRMQNFHSRGAYTESATDTHLATRAWAFQERLLSPRTIYFGDTGLFWECRTQISSEFLPDGFPGLLGGHLVTPEDKPWNWRDIVHYYSRAELTYSLDRLPALSGIVSRQQEATGDRYLAGMWRGSLVTQLPWQLVGKKSRRPRWRAPTWSWTSIDGPARYWGYWDHSFMRLEFKDCIRVLEAWTRPSGPDPYGMVTDGELTLSYSHLVRGLVDIDADVVDEARDIVRIQGESTAFPVSIDCLGEASYCNGSVVYLLPVINGNSGMKRIDPKTDGVLMSQLMVQGLVLRAYDDSQHPQNFYRIGSFAFLSQLDDDGNEDIYKAFMKVLEIGGPSVAVSEVDEIVADAESQDRRNVIIIK